MNIQAELKWLLIFFGRPLEEQWSLLPSNFSGHWLDAGSAEVEISSPQRFLVIILSEHLNGGPSFFDLPSGSPALTLLDELRVLLEWFVLDSPNQFIFSAPSDHPEELYLIWRTIGRLCHLVLAEPDVQSIPVRSLGFTDLLNAYGRPLTSTLPRN